MRIANITSYASPKKINFKRFMDVNAEQVTKNALFQDTKPQTSFYSEYEFSLIKECKFVDIYTSGDGKVKAKFDKKYLSTCPMGNGYTLDACYDIDDYTDLSKKYLAIGLSDTIEIMNRIIKGETIGEIVKKDCIQEHDDCDNLSGKECARINAEEMPYW